MTDQKGRAQRFRELHVKGDPLILFNIWDAGSAKAAASTGAKAVATGSWSVAAAQGFDDGEQLPLELMLENLKRIVTSVSLPVSCDVEGGYGSQPADVAEAVAKVLAAGAVGINFEDQIIGEKGLYSVEDQCARIRAVRDAADSAGVALFINARTDIFLKLEPTAHNRQALAEVLRRAEAYAEAGADGFFVPGLTDAQSIEALCRRSPLPVNVMILPDMPLPKQLAELGVARISYGPDPYRQSMQALTEVGRAALL